METYYETDLGELYCGDNLEKIKKIPDNTFNCIITSPPYNKHSAKRKSDGNTDSWNSAGIRYGGFNDDLPEDEYQLQQVEILSECVRILKDDGSIFYNHKPRIKNHKIIFPHEWLIEFVVRQMIVWNRMNSPCLEPIRFLPTTEYIFWITKTNKTPKFNGECFKYSEVWNIGAKPDKNHPAPFPEEIVKRCILATTKIGDVVFDPYFGSGTVGLVAEKLNRKWVGIELFDKYCDYSKKRIENERNQLKVNFT